jgi:adenosylhomocysteinase
MNEVKGLYKVRDMSLADEGKRRIAWAESRMPVLMALKEKYSKTKPFKGYKIAGCLHVTKETAVLVKTFAACGADVSWSGCNPLSTNDSVAAALASEKISIFAWHGMSVKEFYWAIDETMTAPISSSPFIINILNLRRPQYSAAPKRLQLAFTGCAPWRTTEPCVTRSSP